MPLFGGGKKERLLIRTRMFGIFRLKTRLFVAVIDIILGIVWVGRPVVPRIVKTIPNFNLYDDISLEGPLQHILKSLPVSFIPSVKVIGAIVQFFKGIYFKTAFRPLSIRGAVAHRVTDIVASGSRNFL